MAEAGAATVELLDQTWRIIAGLCAGLDEAEFLTPTDCPGWSVKDILAHILGTERTLRGEPVPEVEAGGDHVRNALGAFNERWIVARHGTPGPAVLAEYREVTEAQTAARRRLTAAELAEEVPTPFGLMPLALFLEVRLFDCFSHEQDIRRALGRPGNLDGEVARRAAERGVRGLARAAGKAARDQPDGTRVELAVHGAEGSPWAIVVSGGRGAPAAADAAAATAALRMDLDTFLRLVWGRVSPEAVEADGGLRLSGDLGLARRVAALLNITP
jgi:uncharacterized protein (TIGR03083 family)